MTTRRDLLAYGALATLGWATRPHSALGAVSLRPAPSAPSDQVFVTIFLRGGADGLSLVVPHGDEDYYKNRPTLAIARPSSNGKASGNAVDLDGFFGLHPALSPLLPLYQAGQMAVIPACGSGDQTRSHFAAMATMERGAFGESGPASGWVARHLASAPWENPSPLRAVALGEMLPQSLSGAPSATALHNIADIQLRAAGTQYGTIDHLLGEMYSGDGAIRQAGREALSVLASLRSLSPRTTKPAFGAVYPSDDLGNGLHQTAMLIKSGLGLEAACLDHYGYDTHVAQGTHDGLLANQLKSLSNSIAAFATDLGPARWGRVTVVVLSEFGRRVAENNGLGTDHGRAGAMFVLGGTGIVGGKVHGTWPTLAPSALEGPGDVKVTTDYRSVLAEVIARRLGNPNLSSVFPGLSIREVGVVHA